MPNASWRRRGGKAQGEGYLPSGAKRRTSEAKVCTSAARKTVGKPLAPRQGGALSEVWFPYSRASSTQELSGSRCGRNRPLRWVAEDAQAAEDRRGAQLLPFGKALLRLFMNIWRGIVYLGAMNNQRHTRSWAWMVCVVLFWLTVNPPHCDLCDGVSFALVSSQHSTVQHSHPVAPDSCNGICSCCGFHGLPNVRPILIPSDTTVANISTEPIRAASAPHLNVFRPPRMVIS